MTDGRRLARTAVGGIVIAVAYVALAALTWHLDPLERRPVLDGLAPPPPYRWVSPPPALAASSQPAQGIELDVPISGGASSVGVFLTPDSQAAVLLEQGAVPLPSGAIKATMRIEPLAPPAGAVLPPGTSILGNVYRIDIVIDGAAPSTQLAAPAQVALVYPAQAGPPKPHVVLRSGDGTTFTQLAGNDNTVGQQVITNSASLGYFAAATAPTAGTTIAPPSAAVSVPPSSVSAPAVRSATASPGAARPAGSLLPLLLVGVPIALLVIFAIVEILIRRGGSRRI